MADEVTLGEAAKRFGVSRSTLTYAAQKGHLEARKIGIQWVTTAAAVEQWQAHGKHAPGPAPIGRPPKRRPGRPRKTVEAPPLEPEPRAPRARQMTGNERAREG